MFRPLCRAFFYTRPVLLTPTGNGLFVAFAPGLRVSGNSSRCHAARARPRKGRSGRRNASRSLRRSASASTGRSYIRGREDLLTATVPASGVAGPSTWAGGRDAAWPSSRPVPPAEKSSSTGIQPPARRRVSGPLRWDRDRLRATRRPEAGDIRASSGFPGVLMHEDIDPSRRFTLTIQRSIGWRNALVSLRTDWRTVAFDKTNTRATAAQIAVATSRLLNKLSTFIAFSHLPYYRPAPYLPTACSICSSNK